MIKDLNWIDSVDARCYHFSRYLLSLALPQSPARNGWMSYDTVGGVPYCDHGTPSSLFSVQQIIIPYAPPRLLHARF